MILIAAVAGAIAGSIMLFLSHLAPALGAGNFVKDIDKPRFFGKVITRREAHFVGILAHIFLAAAFGAVYAYLFTLGIYEDFGVRNLLGWSVVTTIFAGGVALPLEGHGFFGVKEDPWFPVDLFLTNVGWAVIFWWIMRLWLPYAF